MDFGEDTIRKPLIRGYAFVNAHAQPAKHYCDQPSSRCAADHIEIVAWLGMVVGVDQLHKLLEDPEGRKALDISSIEGQETKLPAV